jgi:hypothetical protein
MISRCSVVAPGRRAGAGGRVRADGRGRAIMAAVEPVEDLSDGPAGKADHRLPPSLVVLVLITLPFLLPDRLTSHGQIALSAVEAVVLVAIFVGDPGRIDRRTEVMRRLSLVLFAVLILSGAVATPRLVGALVKGDPALKDAATLLLTGALVWTYNNITFALLYWELDSGGPATRFFEPRRYPDFAFPQHLNPEIAPPNWRPTLVDYLYLGLTNSVAFSPTDAMPLSHWAKVTMAAQSLISITILSLVIANAVNVLG